MIKTPRLLLSKWDDRHREAFAAMHADPDVMVDLGGPINESESCRKFERYRAAQREHGVSRWTIEKSDGAFVRYAGRHASAVKRSSPGGAFRARLAARSCCSGTRLHCISDVCK